jgi:hypothetical protein
MGVPVSIGLNAVRGGEALTIRRIILVLELRYFNEDDLKKVFSCLAVEYDLPEFLFVDAYADLKDAESAIRDYLSPSVIDFQPSRRREVGGAALTRSSVHNSMRANYFRRNGEEVFHYTQDLETGQYRTITIKNKTIPYTANPSTDLILAAEYGDKLKAQSIMTSDALERIDEMSKSRAILLASLNGHNDIVRALLSTGVDLTARTERGWTLLMIEASRGNIEIVRRLLSLGADIRIKDVNGNSALSLAVYNEHPETVRLLLENTDDVDAADKNGATPLMKAAANGDLEVVEALLAKHANVSLKSDNGKTALMVAKERNRERIVELLMKAGARD